jgi:hypothetical protein
MDSMIKENIFEFNVDVITGANASMKQYDSYFGQTSEIEYSMKEEYKKGILKPFVQDKSENNSIALPYIRWRVIQTCMGKNNQIKQVEKMKNFMDGAIYKVQYTCGETIYFVYSLDFLYSPSDSKPRIINIFDGKKTSLLPDNNIFDKAKW